ncbi:centriole and centriolar satellite protein ofd1 isoform X5 [Heptranchias perlo]|uniref:centriole and centriolar satellite protein ofd1 isoform X5 n=1 Tax=Heptranchias perlo TaxID=212740 RepID=UPI00355960CE
MASGTSEAISSEELRRRLYQTFKNRGVLDSLKSQLRNQLVHELTHPGLNGQLPAYGHRHQHPSTDEDSLLIQAANSIVADHLRRIGYEYSLSVFYPECGLEKEKVFTSRDLLQIMKINPRSDLYKSIISNLQKDHQKGFLIQFLMELTDYHLTKEYRDAGAQTSCVPQYKESIVDKLQMVDEEYAAFHPTTVQEDFWEAKLLVYRKQIEEQLQAEMQQELQRFKDLELATVRIQEKERSQKDIEELRWKLDKMYQMKSETLITREKNAIERLQKQQEIEEKEIYMQRQSLLKDIEAVRNREVELRQRIEAFELTQNLHEQKNKSVEEGLRRRELAVKNIEETYEQKLKNELCRHQLELQEDYRKRIEKVTANEKRIEAESTRLHEESVIIHSKREELQQVCAQTKKLEVELNAAKAQVCLLMKQNELLNEKLKDVADYTLLKTENVQLLAEIKVLRKQLDEDRCENQKLCEKLNQPTAAHLALQAELKKAEYSRRLDQDEHQSHKQILEQQLQNEMERCAQVRSQLMEYEDQTRRLNGQVDDLKLQLRQTQLGDDGSFLVSAPSAPEHQTSITTNEIHSYDCQIVNSPLSVNCGTNERSENTLIDNPVSRQSSTIQRFEELIAQPDDHCEIVQEGIPTLNKDLSQYWEEKMNRGSVSSLDQETILSPPDTCKFRSPEQEEKIREEEDKAWEDQRRRDEEKRCLERQEAREREQRELERLEQEKMLHQMKEEKPKTEPSGQSPEEQIPKSVELPASSTDPLEKYMKIIQQQKEEEQQDKSSKKEVAEECSLLQTLSDGKAGSPAASQEEADDIFW